MKLSFTDTNDIDFFAWFKDTISTIYGIKNLPSTSKGLNSYDGGHEVIHAFCDTKFNNWEDDPMATDLCEGNVFRFKHKDSPFTIKFHVIVQTSMMGPLNIGVLCLADEDPTIEEWVALLKRKIPDLKEGPGKINNCTKTCQILNKYWAD